MSPTDSPEVLAGKTQVTERIIDLLSDDGADHELFEHQPVFTSEQAAEIRGTTPEQGAKALIVKAKDDFHMILLPGNRRSDNSKVRKILGTKHLRFAKKEELLELTGCLPGSVPPFGNLFDLPVWIDCALAECDELAFNAGSHTVSLKMKTEDLIRLTEAKLESFSQPP